MYPNYLKNETSFVWLNYKISPPVYLLYLWILFNYLIMHCKTSLPKENKN